MRITLHEAAHSWHLPSLAAEVTMPTHVERAALLAYARDHGWPLATAAASAADDEALAHACTWAWLAAADAR